MKKQSLLFLLMAALMIGITSCGDDEETFFDRPDVAPPSSDPAVQVGTSTTFNVAIDAPAGIASVTASANGGTVTVDNADDLVGEVSGTANLTYQAPMDEGVYRITITVTDEQSPAKSQELRVPVDVTPEPQKEIVDVFPSLEGTGTVTWTADKIYVLRGFIFVNDGQTLTIDPGTVIKGQPGQGSGASALIVARGGTINAMGEANNPVIFTGLADDLEGSLPDDANSQWGGIIVLGNGPTNNNDTDGERNIEGIPTEEPRGSYGPDGDFPLDDMDNSGTIQYISIRHGGSLIGSDNEINGLTLGAVGAGTTIENVEVFSNLDDGIEFFGGNVNVSGIVLAYSGDDGIDIDEGYSGGVQKGIVWHTSQTIESDDPSGGEWDGGDDVNEPEMPYATSVVANITFIYDDNGDNDLAFAIRWRDNNSTSLHNSIVMGHDAPFWLEFRDDKINSNNSMAQSSWHRWEAGDLGITKNIFYNINGSNDVASMVDLGGIDDAAQEEADFEAYIADNNAVIDPAFGTGGAKFTPSAAEATSDLAALPSGFDFMDLQYKGGVDPAAAEPFFANWTKTWEVIQ